MYLDTHVVVWIAAGLHNKLSRKATNALENSEHLLVSPVVALELTYLYEIKRITHRPADVLAHLGKAIGLRTTDYALADLINVAMGLSWTRDVFDRLIVSECIHAGSSLITRDTTIRKHFKLAAW